MAREFNGAAERINFGSDASIDGWQLSTWAFWVQHDDTSVSDIVFGKDRAAVGPAGWLHATGIVQFFRGHSTTNGLWGSTGTLGGGLHHVVIAYDAGSVNNDPLMWIDGVAQTVVESTAPVGSLDDDASRDLLLGEDGAGTGDLDGAVQHFTAANALWDSGQVNRHRWWGRPGGAVAVHHPLLTTKLTNEGTATANGTATGTTMRSLPRVMRPGCGGW